MFVIFPPEEQENLYVHSFLHPLWGQSQVDFEAVDTERFPRFADARAYYALLQPGDTLYLPPFWWHYVSNRRCWLLW